MPGLNPLVTGDASKFHDDGDEAFLPLEQAGKRHVTVSSQNELEQTGSLAAHP